MKQNNIREIQKRFLHFITFRYPKMTAGDAGKIWGAYRKFEEKQNGSMY